MSQRRYVFVLLLLLLASCILVPAAKAEVINLTADTFSDKDLRMLISHVACSIVYGKDIRAFALGEEVTKLYPGKKLVRRIPIIGEGKEHCLNMGSLWEDLARAVEGEDEIEIGQVDCSTSKSICTKVDIHSYPTFKVFYDGEEFAKYQGL
ncbi:Protein disulfide-isomerase like 2-2 [Asimina triloba]